MHWFLASLIAPAIWSLVNHVDKIILSRYFHGGGAGGLMIFVGVVSLPLAALIYIFQPSVISIAPGTAIPVIASGILYNAGIYFYLKALEKKDTSYVVPFWQLIPVFTYLLGIVLLGEFIEEKRLFGGVVVIFGVLVLSMSSSTTRKMSLDIRTIAVMVVSSFCMALGYVLFKDGDSATTSFWSSTFWNQIGMTLFAVLFAFVPAFWREFTGVIKANSTAVLGLNTGEQVAEIIGVLASNYAILLAPAALVILVEYTAQPLFVFLFGILFTILFPRFVQENISKRILLQKIIAIAIMTAGLVFVVR